MTNVIRWTDPVTNWVVQNQAISAGANYLSPVYAQNTENKLWAEFSVSYTPAAAPTAGDAWYLYLIRTPNVSSHIYEMGDASVDPVRAPDLIFPVPATSGFKRLSAPAIPLPLNRFKFLVRSELSQNATGVNIDMVVADYSIE